MSGASVRDRSIDPFKLLGEPSTWGDFGSGTHDVDCDAERRAMYDFMVRRLEKGERRGNDDVVADLLTGGAVAFAGLFISAAGGAEKLPDDAFDRWIAIMTFAWYQALSVGAGKA